MKIYALNGYSFIYFNYTGQTVNHWFVQGDQPQEKDNYTNTVRLANYLNACIHQLQINQIDCNSIKWWGKTFQSTTVLGKKLNLYGLELINGSE